MLRTLITFMMIALALSSSAASAQGYKIDWYSINCGGGEVASGSYVMTSTIGQSAAGLVSDSEYIHWIGFWAGEIADPVVCSSVSDAKSHPDGTLVSVGGKVATSAIGDFAGFFYVEEADRSSGIRVSIPPDDVAGLARGSVVNVIGTLGTTAHAERELTGPMVIIVGSITPVKPLGMINRSLGGANLGAPPEGQAGVTGGSGLNTVGLLVTTWGRVSYLPGGVLAIDDGSRVVVRIDSSTLSTLPADDSYVFVTGVSSLWKSAGILDRLVLPRGDADIVD